MFVCLCIRSRKSPPHVAQNAKYTGWSKKWGHYIWRLRSLHAHIFKMPKQISVIFGLLQCRYILNTSVDSIFIKFIIHVWAFWRCGHAKIWAFKRSGLTFLDHPVNRKKCECGGCAPNPSLTLSLLQWAKTTTQSAIDHGHGQGKHLWQNLYLLGVSTEILLSHPPHFTKWMSPHEKLPRL